MERNYVIVILCFLSFHAECISCRLTLQTVLLCVEYEVSNDYVDISGSRHATDSLRLIYSSLGPIRQENDSIEKIKKNVTKLQKKQIKELK